MAIETNFNQKFLRMIHGVQMLHGGSFFKKRPPGRRRQNKTSIVIPLDGTNIVIVVTFDLNHERVKAPERPG
jgi:hypothetical protein